MRRSICYFVLSAALALAGTGFAGDTTAITTAKTTATCNFDSTKQVAVEYQPMSVDVKKEVLGNEIPYGKVWAPGGKPMTLFTNTPVAIGGKDLPIGAYTLFAIPEEKKWTLIVSKSTDTSGKYDEVQDLARITMQFGELPSPEPEFSIYFAHDASDQCSMRLDLDKARAWIAIKEE